MTLSRRPPRLLLKTLVVTFSTAASLLAIVFLTVRTGVRDQVRQTVAQNLEISQGMAQALEDGRLRELRTQAETLVESPTLKAAVDTYTTEAFLADSQGRQELLTTIQRELDKLAERVGTDAVGLEDQDGRVLATAGRLRDRWQGLLNRPLNVHETARADGALLEANTSLFRVIRVPLMLDDGAAVGWLDLGSALDLSYAEMLDRISRARTAIVHNGLVVASTLNQNQARDLGRHLDAIRMQSGGTLALDGSTYAYRELAHLGAAQVYALGSIEDVTSAAMERVNLLLASIAIGAFVLALAGSVWLARLLTAPIARLTQAIEERTIAHDLTAPLPATRSSRELDSLTDTFNQLMASVASAEEKTEAAYASAIRALAAALDARDPYTAGHSERVSALSVAVGRILELPDAEIEVLRLGALMHDIGKIGIPDYILRKPSRLTDDEYEIIKEHPTVGARILSTIPFLQPHLPIVELHHERPDGLGYPKGLRGDEIPLAASIVHVADAYDAITSARAYRQGRSSTEALRELWRCAGTEYHAEIVSALARALTYVEQPAPVIERTKRAEVAYFPEAASA